MNQQILWSLNALIATLIIGISLLFKLKPPVKINRVYGYRTKRSMATQEAWDEGNRYSSRLMLYLSFVTVALQGLLAVTLRPTQALMWTVGAWVAGLCLVLVLTERRLKRKFDAIPRPGT